MQGIKFSFDDQCSNDRSSTTKGVNFIFSSFPESFRATQTIPDLASCRFIRNDTSFRVLTISCWRPVNIPSMMANVAYIIRQSWPTDCRWIFDTIKLPDNSSMSAVIFLFVRFGFHSCRVVGHGFRAFCVILFFWGLFVWRDLGGGQFSNDSSRSSPN